MQAFSLRAQFGRESAMLKLPQERRRWGKSKKAPTVRVTISTLPIFHCHKIKDGGYNNITNTNKVLPAQKNACTAGYFVCEIYYWDLRTLNNAKPYFFLNEMNKKDLPAMYSTAFWYLFVVLLVVLALLRNRCYFFHRTNWRVQGLTFSQCKSLVDVSFPPLHPSCIV